MLKGNACESGSKPSWRSNTGSFMHKISNRVGPQKLARLIFWFAHKASPKQISSRASTHQGSASHACLWIRATILKYMLKLTEDEMISGGYDDKNIVVLVDETYITKKNRQRGGFQGRTTTGNKTIVLGFFELNISEEPRCGTGRAFLIEIPNTKRSTIEAAIRKHVRQGSIIWTDGHKSYKWLCQGVQRGCHSPISGYTWDWVNHKQGEFVRGSGVERVSTNGVGHMWQPRRWRS